jgi:hypothetical protein
LGLNCPYTGPIYWKREQVGNGITVLQLWETSQIIKMSNRSEADAAVYRARRLRCVG